MKTTKKALRLLAVLCLLFAFGALFSVCAADKLTDGIFTYTVNETKKTATIVGINVKGVSEVRIPETIGEYTVESISYINSTYLLIGTPAEPYPVYIPQTINNIVSRSFIYNDAKEFVVDAENRYYSSDEKGVLYNKDKTLLKAFPGGSGLEEFTVPDGVTRIEGYAFDDVRNLKKVNFPESLEIIGEQAFTFSGLASVNIPKSVTYVGSNAFLGCRNLTEVEIPGTLKTLGGSAFSDCYNLEKVTVNEGVNVLEIYAFENDKALKYVYLPSTLQKIKRGVFGNCISLTEINYAGSEEDWKKIDIDMSEYISGRKVVIDTVKVNYNATLNSDEGLDFDLQSGVLAVTSTGEITKLEKTRWNYFSGDKSEIKTVILNGNINSVGAEFFSDMPALGTVIVNTDSITFEDDAFVNCPELENVILFKNSSFTENAFSACAETVNIFENPEFSNDFSDSSEGFNVVYFEFQNGVLAFSGSLSLDTYALLDLTAAFSLKYDSIEKVRFENLTLDGMRLNYYAEDGLRPVEENTLENCEIYPALSREKDSAITFNKLGEGVADKSITDFFLIMTSESHGDITDPPIKIEDDNEKKENGIISAIKKALRWIVTLLNALFKLFGRR